MELHPGDFRDCYWNPDSAFVYEEFWGDIESIIASHTPNWNPWNHYGVVTIDVSNWRPILTDFGNLSRRIQCCATMTETQETLPSLTRMHSPLSGSLWRRHALQYAMLVRDLIAWCTNELEDNDSISILGI